MTEKFINSEEIKEDVATFVAKMTENETIKDYKAVASMVQSALEGFYSDIGALYLQSLIPGDIGKTNEGKENNITGITQGYFRKILFRRIRLLIDQLQKFMELKKKDIVEDEPLEETIKRMQEIVKKVQQKERAKKEACK